MGRGAGRSSSYIWTAGGRAAVMYNLESEITSLVPRPSTAAETGRQGGRETGDRKTCHKWQVFEESWKRRVMGRFGVSAVGRGSGLFVPSGGRSI